MRSEPFCFLPTTAGAHGPCDIAYNRVNFMSTLDHILLATRARVAQAKASADVKELERLAAQHTPRGFSRALREKSESGPAVIAELKRASPSKGMIRGSFHPAALALELCQAGAAALSILTEEEFAAKKSELLARL